MLLNEGRNKLSACIIDQNFLNKNKKKMTNKIALMATRIAAELLNSPTSTHTPTHSPTQTPN